MRKIIHQLLLFLLIAGFLTCGCSELLTKQDQSFQLKPGYDPNALVLLAHIDHRQNETRISWPRVAFAVGDGTILLTAKHCVDNPSNWIQHPLSPEIVVISPYYGDIYRCDVIAVDKKTDLAILKAPWRIHPALTLASEEDFQKTREVTVFSRPIRKPKKPHELGRKIRTATLTIEQKNVKRPIAGMKLKGSGPIGHGWSGSAIVIPKSAKATGVISALSGIRLGVPVLFSVTFIFDTIGGKVDSIWEMLRQNNLQYKASSYYPLDFEPVADAHSAYSAIMDYFEDLLKKENAESLEAAKKFVKIRPESGYAYLLLAVSAESQEPDSEPEKFLALAESSYEKSLQLDPNNASTRAAYGNFLLRRKLKEQALAEAEAALALDPNNELAAINRLTVLTQTEPNKAKEYAEELIDKDPNNSDYWFQYGCALTVLDKNEQALEAVQKAIKLNPKGGYRGGLADILVKLDRLNEAEKNYKKMTKSCGCQRCWFKYARFLVHHRPKKLDRAEKALAKAEAKAHMLRISKEDMVILRLNLTSAKFNPLQKKSPKKAESLARKLIKKSPDNGYNYWALATALRAQDRFNEAVTAAEQAVKLCPDCSFRPRLADCLAKAGELEKAEQTYEKMLELYPDRPRYWFWYADFLVDYYPDKIEQACEALEKAKTASDKRWPIKDQELKELLEKIEKNTAVPQEIENK
jgi:tetratricopeptide (TPR) repeat protein